MGRYYAKSRAKFIGRIPETFVSDSEQKSDKTGGPLIVVETYGNESLAKQVANLLNRNPKNDPAPQTGTFRAKKKLTGQWFSSFGASLERCDLMTSPGSTYWRVCASVRDFELAQRIANLLNAEPR